MAVVKPDIQELWADGGAVTDPGAAKKLLGWIAEIPTHQVANFIENRQDNFLAHINCEGIAVYDVNTDYPIDGLAKGSDGQVYIGLTTPNVGNDPLLLAPDWALWSSVIAAPPPLATTVLQGVDELATQAEANAGVLLQKIITPQTLANLNLGSLLLADGYVTLPGGVIIQWTKGFNSPHLLPIAFPNNVFQVVGVQAGPPPGSNQNLVAFNFTLTQFEFTPNAGAFDGHFIAIGN